MESLPSLVQRLRQSRGLRQRELAEKAGYGEEVVSRLEQGRGAVRPLTARAIFRALAEAKPLTEREAHDFLAGCGLIEPSPDGTLPPREMHEFLHERPPLIRMVPEPPASFAQLSAHEEPTEPMARLARRLELAIGLERASLLLRTILDAVEPAAAIPSQPHAPSPMLVHPPRPLEDRTVQVIAPVKPPEPAARSAPLARRRKAR